jgi:hypothetical protein
MNIAAKAVRHAAPGPYLGFALQPLRLCFHLLTCPNGAQVSLEYLDDVAIHFPAGNIVLEQTKSALSQNPITNWSDEFWKTIANWIRAIESKRVDGHTSAFRLYVTPERKGAWAQAMSEAATAADVGSLVKMIAKKRAGLQAPKSCEKHLQIFLGASEHHRAAVVLNFTLDNQDADPLDPLRKLVTPTVVPELVDALCQAAIGMAKEQADRLIRSGKPAILNADKFKTDFRAFVRRISSNFW